MMGWQMDQTRSLASIPRALADIAKALRDPEAQATMEVTVPRGYGGDLTSRLKGKGWIGQNGWVHITVPPGKDGEGGEFSLPPHAVARVRWLA